MRSLLEVTLETAVCTAIGRQLGEYYDVAQPPSERLTDLMEKIERSKDNLPYPRDEGRAAPTEDA